MTGRTPRRELREMLVPGAALLRGWHMRPAVVRNFMPGLHHSLAAAGMTLDGEAGHEPGAANAMHAQEIENPARADEPELAA